MASGCRPNPALVIAVQTELSRRGFLEECGEAWALRREGLAWVLEDKFFGPRQWVNRKAFFIECLGWSGVKYMFLGLYSTKVNKTE